MITARQYEDQMLEIVRDYRDQPETMRKLMDKLTFDALDSLGYTAGARIFAKAREIEYNKGAAV